MTELERATILRGQISLTQRGYMLLVTHKTTLKVATVLFDDDISDYVIVDGEERWASGLDSDAVMNELVDRGYLDGNGYGQIEVKK